MPPGIDFSHQRLPAVLQARPGTRTPAAPDIGTAVPDATRRLDIPDRREWRLSELERATDGLEIEVPDPPRDAAVRKKDKVQDPADDAHSGRIPIARSGWIAKFRPNAVNPEYDFGETDVFWKFPWNDVPAALDGAWIGPWLRGAQKALRTTSKPSGAPVMQPGDLVFLMRTDHANEDPAQLRRLSIVGVTWVESTASHFENSHGALIAKPNAILFPLRRFDFPVPIKETRAADPGFNGVRALSDTSRLGLIPLALDELMAVTRACGLPAGILAEVDPNQLVSHVLGMDCGPPQKVRRRILEGARAVDHRDHVEHAARSTVVRALTRAGMGVRSVESCRGASGYGADLVADCVEGSARRRRFFEVKGLSGSNPLSASITRHQKDFAEKARGTDAWWLVIVTNALHQPDQAIWLSADDVLAIFTQTRDGGRTWSANRGLAEGRRP